MHDPNNVCKQHSSFFCLYSKPMTGSTLFGIGNATPVVRLYFNGANLMMSKGGSDLYSICRLGEIERNAVANKEGKLKLSVPNKKFLTGTKKDPSIMSMDIGFRLNVVEGGRNQNCCVVLTKGELRCYAMNGSPGS